MLCVLIKVLSHASAIKKTERLKGFKFRTFISRFQMTSHLGSEGVKGEPTPRRQVGLKTQKSCKHFHPQDSVGCSNFF